MNSDFNPKQEEYNQLIEQRKLLIDSISSFTKAFHTALFSVVGTLLVAIPIAIGISNEKSKSLAVFGIVELFLASLVFIMMLLFTTNHDRDYIRAIDQYIKDKYGVKTLFYQGEVSYRHINKTNSSFSIQTIIAGCIVGAAVLAAAVYYSVVVLGFFKRYPLFSWVVLAELIGIIAMIASNFVYKSSGNSKYYDDCLKYLKTGQYSAPQKHRAPQRRKRKRRKK
jgi:fumarate reductase subunit D